MKIKEISLWLEQISLPHIQIVFKDFMANFKENQKNTQTLETFHRLEIIVAITRSFNLLGVYDFITSWEKRNQFLLSSSVTQNLEKCSSRNY